MTVEVKECPWNPKALMVEIRIKLPDGGLIRDRKKVSFTARSAAQRWGEERERELFREALEKKEKPKKKEAPTLAAFAPEWMEKDPKANRRKYSVIVSYQSILDNHLVPLFGSKRLNDIKAAEVAELKAKLKGRAPKTVNNVLSVLSKLLKSAKRWGLLDEVPEIELLKIDEKEMEFYTDEEYERLVAGAELVAQAGTKWGAADRRPLLIVLLGGDAGLRCSEILALRWTDIDWDRNRLRVQEGTWRGVTSSTKGRRVRHVEMTSRLRTALQSHRHLGERVLVNNRGAQPLQQSLWRWLERAERAAGMPITGRLHILRHTFCSRLAARGATLLEIKELAGHRSTRTTMRYMHLAPSATSRAIGLLEGSGKRRAEGEVVPLSDWKEKKK